MSREKNKKDFFGLTSSAKAKIVRKASDLATKEQLDLVNRHGGIKVIKNYCNCG